MNIKYLKLAIQLAEQGRGKTSPNPFVGAIIVNNGKIVGTGYTQPWGKNHAEIQALNQAKKLAQNADLYVTLEPCCHYGKTPPCVDAIIKNKIKNVYAGIVDPNPKVSGKGFKKLIDAGINVKFGLLKKQIKRQLEYYIHNQTTKTPFVILKNATSLNAKINNKLNCQTYITDEKTQKKVHELRQEVDAIITGINTINCDNPTLNVRLENPIKQPARIVLDPSLDINLNSNLVKTAKTQKLIVVCNKTATNIQKNSYLQQNNVNIIRLPEKSKKINLQKLLKILYSQNISCVLLETGSKLASSFLNKNLVNKIYYYVSPKIFAKGLPVFNNLKNDINRFKVLSCKKIQNDVEIILTLGE